MEDYVEVAVARHVHNAGKLWDWKLRPETVRPHIERAMKETGSRELGVVMPVVRKQFSKENTNPAAQILIGNIQAWPAILRSQLRLAVTSGSYSVLTNKGKASIITFANSLRLHKWEEEQCTLLLRQAESNTKLARAKL